MGMSTYIVAIKPPDDTWRKHKAVWDACSEAGVNVPPETTKFFEHEPPDESGVIVFLDRDKHYRQWDDRDMCSGLEIDIASIPEGTKTLRFVNSW